MLVTKARYNSDLEVEQNARAAAEARAQRLYAENVSLRNALAEVLEQRTPAPNATVTRMARIAEEALGEGVRN